MLWPALAHRIYRPWRKQKRRSSESTKRRHKRDENLSRLRKHRRLVLVLGARVPEECQHFHVLAFEESGDLCRGRFVDGRRLVAGPAMRASGDVKKGKHPARHVLDNGCFRVTRFLSVIVY